MARELEARTSLRTSESAAEETNVIASPLVPNLPALPTCHGLEERKHELDTDS